MMPYPCQHIHGSRFGSIHTTSTTALIFFSVCILVIHVTIFTFGLSSTRPTMNPSSSPTAAHATGTPNSELLHAVATAVLCGWKAEFALPHPEKVLLWLGLLLVVPLFGLTGKGRSLRPLSLVLWLGFGTWAVASVSAGASLQSCSAQLQNAATHLYAGLGGDRLLHLDDHELVAPPNGFLQHLARLTAPVPLETALAVVTILVLAIYRTLGVRSLAIFVPLVSGLIPMLSPEAWSSAAPWITGLYVATFIVISTLLRTELALVAWLLKVIYHLSLHGISVYGVAQLNAAFALVVFFIATGGCLFMLNRFVTLASQGGASFLQARVFFAFVMSLAQVYLHVPLTNNSVVILALGLVLMPQSGAVDACGPSSVLEWPMSSLFISKPSTSHEHGSSWVGLAAQKVGSWCTCCVAALLCIFVIARWLPELYHGSSYATPNKELYAQFIGKHECVLVPTSSEASFELLEQIFQPHEIFVTGNSHAKISEVTARTVASLWFFVLQSTSTILQFSSRLVAAGCAACGWDLLLQLPDMPLLTGSLIRELDASAAVPVWSMLRQLLLGAGAFLMFFRPVELSLLDLWKSHTVQLPSLFVTSRGVADGSLQSFAPVGPVVFSAIALVMAIFEIFSNAVHQHHLGALFLRHAEGHFNGAFFAVLLNVLLLVFLPGAGIPPFLQLLAQFIHMSTGALLIVGAVSLPSDWNALSSRPQPNERVYCPSLHGSHMLSAWNEVILFAALLGSAAIWRLFVDEPTNSTSLEHRGLEASISRIPPRARAGSAAAAKPRPIPPTFTESNSVPKLAPATNVADRINVARVAGEEARQPPLYRESVSGVAGGEFQARPTNSDLLHVGSSSSLGVQFADGTARPRHGPSPGIIFPRQMPEVGGITQFRNDMLESGRSMYGWTSTTTPNFAPVHPRRVNYPQNNTESPHYSTFEDQHAQGSPAPSAYSYANLQPLPVMSRPVEQLPLPTAAHTYAWPAPPTVGNDGSVNSFANPVFRHTPNVPFVSPATEFAGPYSGVKRSRASAPPADEPPSANGGSADGTEGTGERNTHGAVPVSLPPYQYGFNQETPVPGGWYGVYQQQQFQADGELGEHVFKRLRM
jgi:hypothetical protein